MKTTLNKVMQAAVAAAALTFATASYADVYTYTPQGDMGGQITPDAATTGFFKYIAPFDTGFGVVTQVGVSVYEMANTNGTQKYLAYCIQPAVDIQQNATYTANYNFAPSQAVQKLYESSYASTAGNQDRQIAFQLALWELQNDDGDLTLGQQHYALNDAGNPQIDIAAQMLTNAASFTLTNQYRYVSFSGVANGQPSQELLGVSAVPEADTWAMMTAGLGLVGLIARRKQKNDKKA